MARRWLAVVLVVFVCGLATGRESARAHPLGSGIINRYARLDSYRDRVRLTYVLDFGWAATGTYLPTADTNHDGSYSVDELDAFARSVQTVYGTGLRMTERSQPLDVEAKTAGLVIRPDVNGFPTVKLTLIYDAAIPAGASGDIPLGFEDLNFEDNAVWKEIVVYGSPGAAVDIPKEFTVELSEGLDAYPPLDSVTIPGQDKAGWTWTAGTGAAAPALVAPTIDPGGAPLPTAAPSSANKGGGGGFSIDWRIGAIIGACVVSALVVQFAAVRMRRRSPPDA